METEVHFKLESILKKVRPREFGQICQDLLALTFVEIGCPPESIEIRNIEGVDIIIDNEEWGRYAIEVKTTSGEAVKFGQKDFKGLKKYSENGYNSVLAVLKLDLTQKWILHNAKYLKPKKYPVNSLYTDDEFKKLARDVNEKFQELVMKHYTDIQERGQDYIRNVLRKKGIKYSGE